MMQIPSEKGIFRMSTQSQKLLMTISILLVCALAGCGGSTTEGNTTAIVTPTSPAISTTPAAQFSVPATARLVLSDPLKDKSKGYAWDETIQPAGSCGFAGSAYHIKALSLGLFTCNPEAKSLFLSNLVYEINLVAVQGNTEGVAFRFDQSNATGYIFFIDTQGSYSLSAVNGLSIPSRTITSGISKVIAKGAGQSNKLAVIADGNSISIYINHQFIAKANDASYNQGQLGIFTVDSQSPTDVEASNAMAWTL